MNLQTAILIVLNNVHPLLLREEVAQVDVNCLLPTPVTLSEVRAGLRALELRWLVLAVRADEERVLWKITARGRAALTEQTQGM
jgi:hypothetical protein